MAAQKRSHFDTSRYRFLISKSKIKIFPIGKKNRLRYCIGINLKNLFRQKNDFWKIVSYALLNVHSSYDETDNWYSEKMRQVRKRPEDHEKWRIWDSQLYFAVQTHSNPPFY